MLRLDGGELGSVAGKFRLPCRRGERHSQQIRIHEQMLAARDALADGFEVEGVSGAAEEIVRNPESHRRWAIELVKELPMVNLGCVYAVEDGGDRAWNAIHAGASHQFGENRDRQRLGR